jgi:hypothetical protein
MKGSGAPAATRNRTAGQVRAPETHNRDRSARILAEAHVETEAIHLRHGRPEASGSSSARAGRRRDGRNGNAGREVGPSFLFFGRHPRPAHAPAHFTTGGMKFRRPIFLGSLTPIRRRMSRVRQPEDRCERYTSDVVPAPSRASRHR